MRILFLTRGEAKHQTIICLWRHLGEVNWGDNWDLQLTKMQIIKEGSSTDLWISTILTPLPIGMWGISRQQVLQEWQLEGVWVHHITIMVRECLWKGSLLRELLTIWIKQFNSPLDRMASCYHNLSTTLLAVHASRSNDPWQTMPKRETS
jgi:hypothetical protein